MWESLIAGAIGGIFVNGFAILAGAVLWVRQRRWEMSRDANKDLLPLMGQLFSVHRSLWRTLESGDPRYFNLLTERWRLSTEFDKLVLYAKVFLSADTKGAIETLEDDVEKISTPLSDLEKRAQEDPRGAYEQGKQYYMDLANAYERAIELAQRSAERDLALSMSWKSLWGEIRQGF